MSSLDDQLEFDDGHDVTGSPRTLPSWLTGLTARVLPGSVQTHLERKSLDELKCESIFIVRRALLDTAAEPKEDGGLADLVKDLFHAARSGELANNVLAVTESFVDSRLPSSEPSTALVANAPKTASHSEAARRLLRLAQVTAQRVRLRAVAASHAFWASPMPPVTLPTLSLSAAPSWPVAQVQKLADSTQRVRAAAKHAAERVMNDIEAFRQAVVHGETRKLLEEQLRAALARVDAELDRAGLGAVKTNVASELAALHERLVRGEALAEHHVKQAADAVKLQLSRVLTVAPGDVAVEQVLRIELDALGNDARSAADTFDALAARVRAELADERTSAAARERIKGLVTVLEHEAACVRAAMRERFAATASDVRVMLDGARAELGDLADSKFKAALDQSLGHVGDALNEGENAVLARLGDLQTALASERARLAHAKKPQLEARVASVAALVDAQLFKARQRIADEDADLVARARETLTGRVDSSHVVQRMAGLREALASELAAVTQTPAGEAIHAKLAASIKTLAVETDKLRAVVSDTLDVHVEAALLRNAVALVETVMRTLADFRVSLDRGEDRLQERFAAWLSALQAQISEYQSAEPHVASS